MAGDWIKMRTNLREDPAVFKLSEILSVSEFAVVGMLHAFWSWMDDNSVDGRVDGASSRLVDARVRAGDGFADALVKVGWLIFDEKGASMPNNERHNGKGAKERLLKNQRQAKWRDGKNSVDGVVDKKSSTREEKRREYKSSKSSSPRKIVVTGLVDPERIDRKSNSKAESIDQVLKASFADVLGKG